MNPLEVRPDGMDTPTHLTERQSTMAAYNEAKEKFWLGVILGAVGTCSVFAICAYIILALFPA